MENNNPVISVDGDGAEHTNENVELRIAIPFRA